MNLINNLLLTYNLLLHPIEVAIIDTGVKDQYVKNLCDDKSLLDYTQTDTYDYHGHGTNILGIISNGLNKKICYRIYKVYTGRILEKENPIRNTILALNNILLNNVSLVNISMAGGENDAIEGQLIKKLLDKNVKIVVAAGNDNVNLNNNCKIYPACYDAQRILIVGNGNSEKNRNLNSNYGSNVVKIWRWGNNINSNDITLSGTSQSAAIYSNELIKNILYNTK